MKKHSVILCSLFIKERKQTQDSPWNVIENDNKRGNSIQFPYVLLLGILTKYDLPRRITCILTCLCGKGKLCVSVTCVCINMHIIIWVFSKWVMQDKNVNNYDWYLVVSNFFSLYQMFYANLLRGNTFIFLLRSVYKCVLKNPEIV